MSEVETYWDENARITLEELNILGQVNNNRAPGVDGVPYAAIKAIIKQDSPNYLLMINNTLESGQVGKMNVGQIILLQKVHQPTSPADYRPIALLNTCYKLVDKIINRRI